MNGKPQHQVLRWVAVLPGAVIAAFIILFPVHWAVMLFHYCIASGPGVVETANGENVLHTIPMESLERFMDALFVPGTLVLAGARIAPKFHFATAIVLASLVGAFLIYTVVNLASEGLRIAQSSFAVVVIIILWLVGFTFALFNARQLDKQADQFNAEAPAATATVAPDHVIDADV